ncbi:hypothetical protein PMAYCL1PPCAC_27160, partial [Pristionchus mayeri]
PRDVNSIEIGNPSDHTETPSEFMREGRRPGLDEVYLLKTKDGLDVKIHLFPTNIAVYDLSKLDMGRFKKSTERVSTSREFPTLQVTITGVEDPIFEQKIHLQRPAPRGSQVRQSSLSRARVVQWRPVYCVSVLLVSTTLVAIEVVVDPYPAMSWSFFSLHPSALSPSVNDPMNAVSPHLNSFFVICSLNHRPSRILLSNWRFLTILWPLTLCPLCLESRNISRSG